ncbi:unnamed protein product [Pedinophyceae sp. YPF-701]|nr:unnamed protein product [Pedinophyceae sp. YPF-701]
MSHRRDHALPEQSTPPRTSSSVPATHKATAFAGATNAAGAPAAALRLSQLPCAAATQGAPPPAGAALVDRSQGRRSSQDRLRFADRSQRGGRQQRGRPDARTAQNDDAGADAPSHGIDGGPPPPSASRRASASFAGKAAAAGPAPPEAAALGVDGLMFEPHGSPAAARGVRGPEDGLPAAPRVGGGAPRSAVVMCHGDALSPRGGQPGSRVAAEAKAATLRPDASGVLGSFGRSFTAPRTSLDRRSLSTLRALSTSTSRRSSTQKTGTVSPAGSTEVALQRAASGSKHAPSVALEVSRSALLAALRQMAADAALPAPAESAAEAKKRSWLSAIRGVHVQLGEGCGRYDTRNAYFLVGPKRRVLLSDVRGLARLFYAAVNAEQRRDGTVSRAMLVGLAQRQGAKHLGMAAGVLKRAIAEPTSALGEARPSVTLRELLAAAFHPATPTELALLSCECLGASLGERQLGLTSEEFKALAYFYAALERETRDALRHGDTGVPACALADIALAVHDLHDSAHIRVLRQRVRTLERRHAGGRLDFFGVVDWWKNMNGYSGAPLTLDDVRRIGGDVEVLRATMKSVATQVAPRVSSAVAERLSRRSHSVAPAACHRCPSYPVRGSVQGV